MNININNKTSYECGDLVELENFGFRMIIKINDKFTLISMDGEVTTVTEESIDELLANRTVISHYKKQRLRIKIKRTKISRY